MAGSTGFEPAIFSVTGRHVRPLHHEPTSKPHYSLRKCYALYFSLHDGFSFSEPQAAWWPTGVSGGKGTKELSNTTKKQLLLQD